MNEDTIKLLKECNAGCKSATNSMEQVLPHVKDEKLRSIIDEYNNKHIKLGDECHQMLNAIREEEMDPKKGAKVSSWLSTELKLMMNDTTHQIAEIMVDGCHMGIKSLSEYINKYRDASEESVNLAKRLIRIEQEFMNDLLELL